MLELQVLNASSQDRSAVALQYVNYAGHVFSASMAEAEAEAVIRDRIGESREAFLQNTLEAHRSGNYDHVLENAQRMRDAEEEQSQLISVGNLKRRNAIENEENTWNGRFQFCYVLGALMLAGAFLGDRFSKTQP